ncbi:MAG: hypothetical protein NT031_02740 [Planctomycetota bacterium]|nr:hypothetical protein [Planctomycetota bacterium]
MTSHRHWLLSLLLPALVAAAGSLNSCADTTQAQKMGLPAPAAGGVLEAFPNAVIVEPAAKSDAGRARLYTAKFYADGLVRDVTVTAEGIVTSVQEPVCLSQLPAPAVAAIGKAAGVTLVVKHDIYAEVRDGQLVAKAKPQTVYDARLVHEGAKATLEVAPDGTVLAEPDWDRPAPIPQRALCPHCQKAPCACEKPQPAKLCPHCQKAPCTCEKPQAPRIRTGAGPMPMHPGAMHSGPMHQAPVGDDDDE